MKTCKDVTANEFRDNIEEIRKNPTAFYEIKVGDIFRTVRLTSFFQVVKVTKTGVKVREIDCTVERDAAGDVISAEPIKDAFLDSSFLLDSDYNEPSQRRVQCYNYDAATITVGSGYNAYLDRKVEKNDEVSVEQSEPVKESDKSADVKPRLRSFSINLKDHKLFSGFGGYIWLPDGYRLNTDMETYRKAVAQAYADYLGDGWRVDDQQQGLAGDGFMLTYEQDDAIDILNWLWSLSDDDGWGIELAVSEQNADNLISYFDNIA